MADNVLVDNGDESNYTVASDDDGTAQHQYVKVEFGGDGTFTKVTSSVGLPVSDAGGSLTVDGTVSVTGVATEATLDARTGALTETAPASDTASSGINGRLQRIAQRLTSLIALVPTSLGQKTKANSFAVTLASDQDALPVTDNGGSLTVDAPVGTPVFVRLSDGSSAIATLPVSLASVPSHAVTNAGTFVVQENGAALTALQLIDDTVFAEDVAAQAADKGVAILAVRRDADTSLVGTDNDYANLQVDATGKLKVEAFSGEALPVTDNGSSLTVDYATTGSGTATGALRVELPTNGTGVIATVGAVTAISNALPAGNNNIGDVDIASLPASTNTLEVVGDVAEDVAIAGNPVRVGGRASTARPTAMSGDGDIVSPWYDRAGALHTIPGAASTATLANVNDTASSTTLLASNTSRKGAIIHNDSTAILYIKYGATASTTSYTYRVAAGDHWEMPTPIYTGALDGIWSADASGAARTTELT